MVERAVSSLTTAEQWRVHLEKARPAVERFYAEVLTHPELEPVAVNLARAYHAIVLSLEQNGTFYLCGNGGSMSDALHISGELLKAFVHPRPLPETLQAKLRELPYGAELSEHLQAGLRAHVLGINPTLASAVANDIPVMGIGYAQELGALARSGDVLLGISTSGRACNVLMAVSLAKALGVTTIGLTGQEGNPLSSMVDIPLCVPAGETSRIQELHIMLYHRLCLMIEAHFFGQ